VDSQNVLFDYPDPKDFVLLIREGKMPPFEQVRVRRHSTPLWQRCPRATEFAPEPSVF